MNPNLTQQLSKLPNAPGVYLFRNKTGKIIYIGKAGSIRKRVQSYFRDQPILLPRIEKMVPQIAKIDFIQTGSEVEALLLESNLIKKQLPKYNVEWKDDKNYLYIKVEGIKRGKGNKGKMREEDFPRIYPVRRPQEPEAKYFGPFTDSGAVRRTLAFLRRIFPYRTCRKFPKTLRLRQGYGGQACLLYHIKRCPGPCIKAITQGDYQKIIKQVTLFLEGKQKKILSQLKKEMKGFAKKREFEKAAKLRDRISALEHIGEVSVLRKEMGEAEKTGLWELINLLQAYYPSLQLHPSFKIESYDISHLYGTEGTGGMIVFIDGQKEPNEYRKFAIKTVKKIDDVGCMKEILRRRFIHRDEWLLPDLIVLDGGKGQLKAAREAQKEFRLNIPAIALAKKEEEIFVPQRPKAIDLPKDSPALHLLQRIRDEAHRFAKSYHIKLRGREVKKSALDEMEGIGPTRKRILLRKFGSIKEIKRALLKEIAEAIGNKNLAKKIKRILKGHGKG